MNDVSESQRKSPVRGSLARWRPPWTSESGPLCAATGSSSSRCGAQPCGPTSNVEEIALLPDAGRGIGTRLLHDVLDAGRQRALYARLGFTVVGIEEPRMAMEWQAATR